MRRVLVFTFWCSLANGADVSAAAHGGQGTASPQASAWQFIEEVMDTGLSEFLRINRPEPQPPEVRARIFAELPAQGALISTAAERTKLAALNPVLDLQQRRNAFDVQVVNLEHALVAVHERMVLLITRRALSLVTAAELLAIGAHELAHEYFAQEFETALSADAYERLQELELKCDGLAVMTLHFLGADAAPLVSAATKLTRYNERLGGALVTSRQVSLEVRVAFIKKVEARLSASRYQR